MIKTFRKLYSCDTSWTGGRNDFYPESFEKLDKEINEFAKENKLVIIKVDYSFANENTQHGPSPSNTTRAIYLIAGVQFRKKIFGF